MDLFGSDMIIGDYKLSDRGLALASFSSASEEEELGMDYEVVEEFIGYNPVPIYLGAKYSNKLTPQATIIKDPCLDDNRFFTENECRDILRALTGFQGYRPMMIISDEVEDNYTFNVRVQKASYYKIQGRVVGIILYLECDSQFAWSKEIELNFDITAGQQFKIFNQSDDLYNYLLPQVTITAKEDMTDLQIINITDNNRVTKINEMKNQEIIVLDSKTKITTSTIKGKSVLNNFNLHFIRLVAGENVIETNKNIHISFKFKLPRKVGFV